MSRDDFIAVQQLIRNAKYKNKGFLPQLRVIDEGVLRGYVSINPRWASFTESDYYEASAYAYDGVAIIPSAPIEVKVSPGEMDLRGFEVARTQFFCARDRVFVSMSKKSIWFSNLAIKKLPGVREVELLIHPVEKMFAVRATTTEDRNHMVWRRDTEERVICKNIGGVAFLPTVFSIMGWELDCRYRIMGQLQEHDGARMLLFDLKEAEMMIPSSLLKTEETGISESELERAKTVVAYPEKWKEGFGNGYYQQRGPGEETIDKWAIDIVGTPVKTTDINATDSETLESEISKMISEMEKMNE